MTGGFGAATFFVAFDRLGDAVVVVGGVIVGDNKSHAFAAFCDASVAVVDAFSVNNAGIALLERTWAGWFDDCDNDDDGGGAKGAALLLFFTTNFCILSFYLVSLTLFRFIVSFRRVKQWKTKMIFNVLVTARCRSVSIRFIFQMFSTSFEI